MLSREYGFNGNFITINYNSLGHIDKVIDTLAREIKFNYDSSNYLSSITQTWGTSAQHIWASFGYTDKTILTNFSGLSVNGPANNSTLHVPSTVTLADGSHFDFAYTSWGQIWKISESTGGANDHVINYRAYDLPQDNTAAQTDCPRFTTRKDWAENWNRNSSGVEQEATTTFMVPAPTSWSMPDNTTQVGTETKVMFPDSTFEKVLFGGATTPQQWQRGLALATGNYDSGGIRQRWTTTKWNQDNPNVSYVLNPRVEETSVGDLAGNRARARTEYVSFNLSDGTTINLPQNIYEYQADATTVLRRSHTTYKTDPNNSTLLDSNYTDKRIIGLVCEKTLYEVNPNTGAETLMSRAGYYYDETGSIQGNDTPVHHDALNFVVGRANLSSVKRYDVANSDYTISSAQYDTAGGITKSTNAAGHHSQISYADSFSDGNNARHTLAYPTTLTDPDGYQSFVKYNFDFGEATEKQTPSPNVDQTAPKQIIGYDSIGRVAQVSNNINGAYTRYEYGPNFVRSYSTVNNATDEALSIQVFDGAGRAIATASNHPGSTGGYRAARAVYDSMGRASKQYNPTETSLETVSLTTILHPSNWAATGDDDPNNGGNGWVYTQQTYDWKGRPLVTTNTDATFKSASYSGCGCAGGEVVTLTDEGTLVNSQLQHRQQKIYSDVLGRTAKTEVLNWDGSVYLTTVNTFNARDQVTLIRQFQGTSPTDPNDQSCPDGTCQKTAMSYDGYGRLQTKHAPEQQVDPNNSASTDHTIWAYNPDDTIHSVTDARSASATYGYVGNNRGLVTSITYSAPASITPTSNVSFAYDAVGNRTSMTDGLGSKSYSYNQLSRLMSETRTFNGVGTFTLSYDYNLTGGLKKITDASNTTINYGYDTAGRLNGVTGSDNLVGGVSNYASGFQYRAWGSLKQISAGAGHTASFGYNARLQANHFDISGGVVNQNYDYFNDGRLSFVHNTTDNNFDRAYSYDHAGRLTAAATGGEARHDLGAVPMYETFAYNAWDNTTTRVSESWLNDFYDSGSYTNGRRTGWGYDADGRIASIDTRSYTNDAAGQNTFLTGQRWTQDGYVPTSTTSDFDGDGKRIRETSDSFGYVTTTYYLRSSVLGGVIVEELNSSGQKQLGYVFTPAGGLLARQAPGNDYVSLKQVSPIGASQYEFSFSGTMTESVSRREFDPVGANVPLNDHTSLGHGGGAGDITGGGGASDSRFSALQNPGAGCVVDGVYTPCDWIGRMLSSGSLALAITSGGKTTRLDLQDFGLGQYRAWVADQGQRLANHATQVGNEFDEHYTIVTNTEEDNLGHWALLNIGFALPQNPDSLWGQRRHPNSPGWRQKPVNWGSACGKFARSLADRLYNTVVRDHPYGDDNASNLAAVGVPMRAEAIDDVDQNGNKYVKGKTPIDGFKEYLTAYGQDADVYHHILFVAGNVLDGNYGFALNQPFIARDWQQAAMGRRESEAELADDYAGEKVGNAMLKTGRAGASGNYENLALTIARELCK